MSASASHDARVGRELGPYVIDGLLGKGGMATVYRAHHRRLGRTVALKVLAAGQDHARFRREGKLLARFRHPGVAQVLDCGREGSVAWYAMPVYAMPTLEALLEEEGGRLPGARAVRLTVSLLAVLGAIHAADIVHRDIKPSNLFVAGDDEVLVSDFGVARPLGACTTLTRSGQILGSLQYLAPETIRSGVSAPSADLYAVGLTLYRAVCGALPYSNTLEDVIRTKMCEARVTPPGTLFPALDPALEVIIDRACRRAPAERFASAAAFRAALERYLDGLVARPERGAPGRTPPRARGPDARRDRGVRSRLLAAWLAAALACGLTLGRLTAAGGEVARPSRAPDTSPPAASAAPAAAGPGALWPGYRESALEREARECLASRTTARESRARAVLERMGRNLPRHAVEELLERACLARGHAEHFLPGSARAPELDPLGVELTLRSMSAARVLETWEAARTHGLESIRRARRGLPLGAGAALVDLQVLIGYLCVVQPGLHERAFALLARELGPGADFSPLGAAFDAVEPGELRERARRIDAILTRFFRASP